VSRSDLLGSALRSLSRALSHALVSEQIARERGVMQMFDPRVRVIGILALVIAVALLHKIAVVFVVFIGAVALALASVVPMRTLALRVWLVVLAFTGIIAFPALFLTPGEPLSTGLPITYQGLHTAVMLIARVEVAATLTTVLVLTTPWAHLLKALRSLGIPKEAVMILEMAHRYIFLLAETAMQMFESRESRRVGILHGTERRHLVSQSVGVLMGKSIDLSHDVFLAMQSRGYRGDVHMLSEQRMTMRDYVALGAFLASAFLALLVGR
jgi:cobalt ECF transporter T component CbiQ